MPDVFIPQGTTTESTFDGIKYLLHTPGVKTGRTRQYRLLVVQHGTREVADSIGAQEYLGYAIARSDPYLRDLVVVAPHFPSEAEAPDGINGKNFQKFSKDGLTWLHELVHAHLPGVFAGLDVDVEPRKFYFFGHSRGGMMVHRYMLKFKSADIHRAAAAAGQMFLKGSERFNLEGLDALTDEQYVDRVDRFIQHPVAIIIGTRDSDRRILNIFEYMNREFGSRMNQKALKTLLVDPPEGSSLAVPLKLGMDDFGGNVLARRRPLLRPEDIGVEFHWTPNGNGRRPSEHDDVTRYPGHKGRRNYPTASDFMFRDRPQTHVNLQAALQEAQEMWGNRLSVESPEEEDEGFSEDDEDN